MPPSPSKSRSRSYSYDYEEEEAEEYMTEKYDRQMKYANPGCCSLPKVLIFLLFLGGVLGVLFGFVGLEELEKIFTGGKNDGSLTGGGGSGGGDGDGGGGDDTGTTPAYEFMQCPTDGEACCNGLESNCNLKVNEIMWATIHNAQHDTLVVPNHEAPFEGGLDVGYRGLMLDVCRCPNTDGELEITFCHGVCNIGARNVPEVFDNINSFLDNNPSEIILINFEMSVGKPSSFMLWEAVKNNDALRRKVYNYEGGEWPTLQEMLDASRQLILFQHNDNDCLDYGVGCAIKVEDYFAYVYENNWDFDNVEAITDTESSCLARRGGDSTQDFYSLNNFVTATFGPSKSSADILNSKDFLEQHIADCEGITKMKPNIVSIDFWQRGDLPEVAQEENKKRGKKRTWFASFVTWIGL